MFEEGFVRDKHRVLDRQSFALPNSLNLTCYYDEFTAGIASASYL